MESPTATRTTFPDKPGARKLIRRLGNPWLMRLFFWQRLPTLILWGVRITAVTPATCTVSLPYGWRSQNPFRSIYFAAQAGAAELSTGTLALIALADGPAVSMLVTEVRSTFSKKASAKTFFTCTEGSRIQEAIQQAIDTGCGQSVTVTSVGRLADGTEVSRTEVTWSFKKKG